MTKIRQICDQAPESFEYNRFLKVHVPVVAVDLLTAGADRTFKHCGRDADRYNCQLGSGPIKSLAEVPTG